MSESKTIAKATNEEIVKLKKQIAVATRVAMEESEEDNLIRGLHYMNKTLDEILGSRKY